MLATPFLPLMDSILVVGTMIGDVVSVEFQNPLAPVEDWLFSRFMMTESLAPHSRIHADSRTDVGINESSSELFNDEFVCSATVSGGTMVS